MAQNALRPVEIRGFEDETQLEDIITLISNDLSEPYSIYVYRYFLEQWFIPLTVTLADFKKGRSSAF